MSQNLEPRIDITTGARLAGLLIFRHRSLQETSAAWQPFVPALAPLSRNWRLLTLRKMSVKTGMWMLVLGLTPRLGGALFGFSLLFQILIHRNSYCTASTLQALVSLQLATSGRELADRLAMQYALIYGGAALNKIRLADWRDGRTIDYFLTRLAGTRLITRLALVLRKAGFCRPRALAARLFSGLAISLELAISLLYLSKQLKAAASLSLLFHLMTVLLSRGGVAWVYLYHALTQGAFFLPAPGGSGKKQGGLWKGIFWLGLGLVVAQAQDLLRKKSTEFYRATPTLARKANSHLLPETTPTLHA